MVQPGRLTFFKLCIGYIFFGSAMDSEPFMQNEKSQFSLGRLVKT